MKFKLRPWTEQDLSDLVRNANNPDVARFLTDGFPHPYSEEAGKAFIEMATEQDPVRIMCIEVDGEACGGIGLHFMEDVYRNNVEMGYWLAEQHWGKGIVTDAIRQMVTYAFDHWEVNRVFARPFGNNKGSQRVLEKAGFELEARFEKTLIKNGVLLDELVYAIRRK